jgi:hypothetical protein
VRTLHIFFPSLSQLTTNKSRAKVISSSGHCQPLRPEGRRRSLLWSRNGGAEVELLTALVVKGTELVYVFSYAL